MVSSKEAIRIVKKYFRKGKIQKYIEYKEWYIFVIFSNDPYEGEMDAIYSVNKNTGEFRDFNYLDGEVFSDIMEMLEKAP